MSQLFRTARTTRSISVAAAVAALAAAGSVATTAPAHADVTALEGDSFAQPVLIAGFNDERSVFNIGATAEPGEPSHARTPSGAPDLADHSIWFKWKSPVTGHVTFRTRGSNFDTVMAAYTGSSLPTLAQIASDDDTDMPLFDGTISHTQSESNFLAQKGVTYSIAVDSFTGSNAPEDVPTGRIDLSYNANDDFSGAAPVPMTSGTAPVIVGGDNTGATVQAGEPQHAGKVGGHSVWYTWTAPKSGEVIFDTLPSDFDTLLAAYVGNSVKSLTEIASNDDAFDNRTSKITFQAKAGKTYRIAVDGFNGAEGIFLLEYHFAQ